MFVFKIAVKIMAGKWARFLLFILAAALLVVFAGFLGGNILYGDKITSPISVIIVDHDNSMESRMLMRMFEEYEQYKNIAGFSEGTEDAAYKSLEENEAAAVLILPENFADNIKNGSNEPFTLVINNSQPLKKILIEYFAQSFTDILSAAQSGVYADLDYTSANYPDSYGKMFTAANLKFLNLVLNRQDILKTAEVSAVSGVSFFTHFFINALIFLNFTLIALFIEPLHRNFNSFAIKKLRLYKTNFFIFPLWLILALFLFFIAVNSSVLIFMYLLSAAAPGFFAAQITLRVLCAVLPLLLALSSLTVFISLLFKHSAPAYAAVSVFSLAGLFLSGGVVPRDFFSPFLKNMSLGTMNYWFYESVAGSLTGSGGAALMICSLFGLLFFALSILLCHIRANS